MSEGYFSVRNRLREVRRLVRAKKNLIKPTSTDDPLFDFLTDLAFSFEREGADGHWQHVIRAMATVAEFHHQEAYDLCGVKNPFTPVPRRTPPASPPKLPILSDRWPIVHEPPHTSSGTSFDADLRGFSALKMFGYTVGTTAGWPERKRREFLSDFMEMDLPPIVMRIFGTAYGERRSMTRILKMANVIAGNANLRLRDDPVRYAIAINDWKNDLKFLKERYYPPDKPRAMWPTV